MARREPLEMIVLHNGWKQNTVAVVADPDDVEALQEALAAKLRRQGWRDERRHNEFSGEVRYQGARRLIKTVVGGRD